MLRDLAQPSHLLILAVLIVVLFGWKKLPDAARSVGRSMRIFKSEMSEMKNDGKESKPSPAASDTVTGVVPPQTTASHVPSQNPSQNGSVDAPVGQPQGGQPARHDNPAL
jgi:sec-independent protein translocase protein TatA